MSSPLGADAYTSGAVPFAELPSRNPVESTRAEHRLDPYFDHMWDYATNARWTSLKTKRDLAARGKGRLRATEKLWTPEEAMSRIATRGTKTRTARLSALATLGLWRTAIPDQVAAFTGSATFSHAESTDRDLLLASELVQDGRLAAGTYGGGLHQVLRPDYRGNFPQMARLLNYGDWIGVTAGQEWKWGSQFDRHNLLGTEIGLRAAEYCDIATSLGEALATFKLLAPPKKVKVSGASGAADAVLLRRDGLRIAIEITASMTAGLKQKIEAWADVLARDVNKTMVVIFVEAQHPERHPPGERTVMIDHLRKWIYDASRKEPEYQFRKVFDRMGYVRWGDWFPGSGLISPSFVPLSVTMGHTGGATPDARWRQLDLMNPADVPKPNDAADATAFIENAHNWFGIPHWTRDPAQQIDMFQVVCERAGIKAGAPTVVRKRHILAAAAAAVGPATEQWDDFATPATPAPTSGFEAGPWTD